MTDLPGTGLMNWYDGGRIKTPIVTTRDIIDVAVDLRFQDKADPYATFSLRNKPNESFSCPLERNCDLYIAISMWSQGGLEFVDPI